MASGGKRMCLMNVGRAYGKKKRKRMTAPPDRREGVN